MQMLYLHTKWVRVCLRWYVSDGVGSYRRRLYEVGIVKFLVSELMALDLCGGLLTLSVAMDWLHIRT